MCTQRFRLTYNHDLQQVCRKIKLISIFLTDIQLMTLFKPETKNPMNSFIVYCFPCADMNYYIFKLTNTANDP